MIANSSKFHAILLSKNCSLSDRIPINIKENLIESETQVDLLGLKIDNRLSFKSHISAICKKAAKQLNVLKRLGSFLSISQCKVLAQSFIPRGVLPNKEVGGGGLDLTSSLEAKFRARSSQVHQIRGKIWEVLSPQDAKVGKKSQFWGHI